MKCYRVVDKVDEIDSPYFQEATYPTWVWADNVSQAKIKAMKRDCFFNDVYFAEADDIQYKNLRAKRAPYLDDMESAPAKEILKLVFCNHELDLAAEEILEREFQGQKDWDELYQKGFKGRMVSDDDQRSTVNTANVIYD